MRIAIDTGGTFTDLVVDGFPGGLRLYKRPTTPDDPVIGILDVIDAAASDGNLGRRELLNQTQALIHGTTRATNAVVTNSAARTAFITTAGHPDILLFREGGERRPAFDYSHAFPTGYVARTFTIEAEERVLFDGSIDRPLDEAALASALESLAEKGVEAVGVCLLWSIVNPVHELAVGRVLERTLPDVPYTLSHRLNPTLREYRRASSTVIDASLKPLMSGYLRSLENVLAAEGFEGRLLIMSSTGGVLDVSAAADAPIHTIGSGPAAAPVAGRHFARVDLRSGDAVVTDAGGTTFDVALVRGGRIPRTLETPVGPPESLFITGFPSVDIRSIGAGGGSIAWVDDGGLLRVGPHSAGADPGPACYGRGGTEPTVTDACVTLGYLDPLFFLGGQMELDADRSREVIFDRVADHLDLVVEEAALAIFKLACDRMVNAIEDITLFQGVDPTATAMVAGGGGAGLYACAIAERLRSPRIVLPEIAAALSAAGALASDLQQSFAQIGFMTTAAFDRTAANAILDSLRLRAEVFLTENAHGTQETELRFSVDARYPEQIWELEIPLPQEAFREDRDVARLVAAFHEQHRELFATEDPEAHIELVSWRVTARARLSSRDSLERTAEAVSAPPRDTRRAYFQPGGWVDVKVHPLGSLETTGMLAGPTIIESTAESIVVPAGFCARRRPTGSLELLPASQVTGESNA